MAASPFMKAREIAYQAMQTSILLSGREEEYASRQPYAIVFDASSQRERMRITEPPPPDIAALSGQVLLLSRNSIREFSGEFLTQLQRVAADSPAGIAFHSIDALSDILERRGHLNLLAAVTEPHAARLKAPPAGNSPPFLRDNDEVVPELPRAAAPAQRGPALGVVVALDEPDVATPQQALVQRLVRLPHDLLEWIDRIDRRRVQARRQRSTRPPDGAEKRQRVDRRTLD